VKLIFTPRYALLARYFLRHRGGLTFTLQSFRRLLFESSPRSSSQHFTPLQFVSVWRCSTFLCRVTPLSGFTYHVCRHLVALFGLCVGPSQGGYVHKTEQTQAVDLYSLHTYSDLVPALTIMNGGGELSLFSSALPDKF